MAYAKAVFDSVDLVRLIYSFGDPKHRLLTMALAEELRVDPNFIHHDYMIRRREVKGTRRFIYTLFDYLRDFTRAKLAKRLKRLERCYCCQRHNRNKPTIHEGRMVVYKGVVTENMVAENMVTENMVAENMVAENIVARCECTCRHYSRIISECLFHSLQPLPGA